MSRPPLLSLAASAIFASRAFRRFQQTPSPIEEAALPLLAPAVITVTLAHVGVYSGGVDRAGVYRGGNARVGYRGDVYGRGYYGGAPAARAVAAGVGAAAVSAAAGAYDAYGPIPINVGLTTATMDGRGRETIAAYRTRWRKMTSVAWATGCSVIAAAIVGGLVSSEIVNRQIAAGPHPKDRTITNQRQQPLFAWIGSRIR